MASENLDTSDRSQCTVDMARRRRAARFLERQRDRCRCYRRRRHIVCLLLTELDFIQAEATFLISSLTPGLVPSLCHSLDVNELALRHPRPGDIVVDVDAVGMEAVFRAAVRLVEQRYGIPASTVVENRASASASARPASATASRSRTAAPAASRKPRLPSCACVRHTAFRRTRRATRRAIRSYWSRRRRHPRIWKSSPRSPRCWRIAPFARRSWRARPACLGSSNRRLVDARRGASAAVSSDLFWLVATAQVALAIGLVLRLRRVPKPRVSARHHAMAIGQRQDSWLACAIVWGVILSNLQVTRSAPPASLSSCGWWCAPRGA